MSKIRVKTFCDEEIGKIEKAANDWLIVNEIKKIINTVQSSASYEDCNGKMRISTVLTFVYQKE